ncbi:MAG: FAD-binding oxidoreductase [Pseudomonadota bacterium]
MTPDTTVSAARASALLPALQALLGPAGVLTGAADCAAFCTDWRGLYQGTTPAVLRPANTAELAAAMRLCHRHGVAVVPQGGNTSMVGGAVPSEQGDQLVLTLSRMNRVRAVDTVDMVMELDAGVPLASAQQAAADAGCMFPLSIGSEGTAQIGGVLSTNAGGNNTVRYGNARDLVLGLEVVMADGEVWNGMRRLRKDNTGYCLRQLFLGSEGTLGIITGAVLRMVPRPTVSEVAFCALPSVEAVIELFQRFQRYDASAVQAFEYMSAPGLELVLQQIPGTARPLGTAGADYPHYALVELGTSRDNSDLRADTERVLEQALEDGLVEDAVVSQNGAQRKALWKLREEHSESQRLAGASVKNDVSVPVSRIPALIAQATAACEELVPGVRAMPFGHIGDGNIHFNLVQPEGGDAAAFLAQSDALVHAVDAIVESLGGSFSAEHGIGRLKTGLMEERRGGAELRTMRLIKQALDPRGLLNPGKVLSVRAAGSSAT